MYRYNRIWNGRLGGVPSALLMGVQILIDRLRDNLSTFLWRGNLSSLGSGSSIQYGVTIRSPGQIAIGSNVCVGRGVEITTEIEIASCTIGGGSQINRNVRLDFSGGLTVGRDVVISDGVVVFTHSHGLDPHSPPVGVPLIVEDGCWIGADSIILESVKSIGANSVVAARSVVSRDVPPGVLVAGVPARLIRVLDAQI